MTERQLLTAFTKIIKKVPGLFWYKIPDTFGGQKKPFDVFAVYRGRPICIEFKKQGSKLEDHQIENILDVQNAGGVALVGVFFRSEKNPKTERALEFPGLNEGGYVLEYKEPGSKEPYPKVQEFLDWVIQL